MIWHRAIIHSAQGGCGNHLRWLLMLDSEFVLFDHGPVVDKVGYILEKVYPETRNPVNWLAFEFKYRQVLNSQIKFAHSNMSGWKNRMKQFESDYNIFSYPADPEIGWYYHFRLLYGPNQEHYLKETAIERHRVEQYVKQHPSLLIDSENFFKPTLDKSLYDSICEFGKFENHYSQANLIHNAWWICRNNCPDLNSLMPEPLFCPYLITEIT